MLLDLELKGKEEGRRCLDGVGVGVDDDDGVYGKVGYGLGVAAKVVGVVVRDGTERRCGRCWWR